MTQRARNRMRPSSDIALADLLARQAAAARPAAARHFEPPKVQAPKGPQTPQIQPPPDLAVNNGPAQLPPGTAAGLTQAVAPAPADTHALGSEAPQRPAPILRAPHASVDSAIQSLAQNPANRRMTVTESDPSRPLPGAPGSNGQAGTQHVEVELKSDPNAPDFRKYLAQVLAIVRANWRRVTPESVHLGTLRGENTIELIINRDGSIPKLVIGDSANIDALDRASVAGVSMSNPLPPLPDDYKGQQVQVTFTFKYNILE
jgi:TonB family protein